MYCSPQISIEQLPFEQFLRRTISDRWRGSARRAHDMSRAPGDRPEKGHRRSPNATLARTDFLVESSSSDQHISASMEWAEPITLPRQIFLGDLTIRGPFWTSKLKGWPACCPSFPLPMSGPLHHTQALNFTAETRRTHEKLEPCDCPNLDGCLPDSSLSR